MCAMAGRAGWVPAGVHPTAVLHNVQMVSVLTGAIETLDIVLAGSRIAALWPVDTATSWPTIDGEGRYAVPGYIDAHLHIESSFVTPAAFSQAVLVHGTTTCAADAHEIANVLGYEGLVAFMDVAQDLPLDIRWMVPSSVPSVLGLETTGGRIDPSDVATLLQRPDVIGLGEVMDAYGIAHGDTRMLEILRVARDAGVIIEGHAPDVTDEALTSLLWEGVSSDHSKSATALLLKKLHLGMFLEFQAKTLRPELIEALQQLPLMPPFALCTDDVSADVLADEGHLDRIGRLAVKAGLTPLQALRAMTFDPAQRLGLADRGVLAPGRRADILLLDEISQFTPSLVMAGGKVVAQSGHLTALGETLHDTAGRDTREARLNTLRHTVHLLSHQVDQSRFRWPAPTASLPLTLRALSVNRDDNTLQEVAITATVVDGFVALPQGVALLTVVDRYTGRAQQSFAPVVGLSLGTGAVASTYSHDAHNLTVLGTHAEDMALAAAAVVALDGGIVVVQNHRVTAKMALPLAGVVSADLLHEVVDQARCVRAALTAWGYRHANPFMHISTMGLLVSPDIRLSDQGLIQVRTRQKVSSTMKNP
ncbi:MAG: adenine deaminase [Sulfobacillus acidophilus]|uniref:Adenine deaminase n=1 Tax=Sulfobacillus acidophilus TaxID=53633 RepID=A0A2T2WGS9_9FIRM|nr:MAG: adenine deaminase [Sulfobacillus acidophilus]